MEQVDLVTSLRDDKLLLLNDDNGRFAPPHRRPCRWYMLAYHRDRILTAAQAFSRAHPDLEGDSGLDFLATHVQDHVSREYGDDIREALKVRIVISASGGISVSTGTVPPVLQTAFFPKSLDNLFHTQPTYRVFVTLIRSVPDVSTKYKTTDRSLYNEVRSVLPMPMKDQLPMEVLLVNMDEEIMEGSLTTPYFKRSGVWITPAATCGGNLGTTRRWALEGALCKEGLVSVNSIQINSGGEKVVLSNGVRGFGWGTIEPLTIPYTADNA